MGDPRRFDLFARFVANLVHPSERGDLRVADVAAGKGFLSWALREHGFRRITPFEPSPRRGGQVRRLGIRVHDFLPEHARDFDLVVGMHPDAATDCILAGAATHGALAVVSPCCIRPNAWAYWGNGRSHQEWEEHLVSRSAVEGLHLETGRLKMTGANRVMWGQRSANDSNKERSK
jgi:hypothetical protein